MTPSEFDRARAIERTTELWAIRRNHRKLTEAERHEFNQLHEQLILDNARQIRESRNQPAYAAKGVH